MFTHYEKKNGKEKRRESLCAANNTLHRAGSVCGNQTEAVERLLQSALLCLVGRCVMEGLSEIMSISSRSPGPLAWPLTH